MILKFKVYEQTISLQSTKSEPRQGSRDYLELQFSFSSDWNDLLKYVYLQHGEVSVPHDLVEESIIVDEYFTEQTEFNVTLLGKSADGSVEVPTNVVTVFLKESNNLWVKDAPEPQNSWLVQVVDARDEALAAAIRAENAAIHQPYPNAETGTWWVWDADSGVYTDTGVSSRDSITIDSKLSDISENPVQNKVVKVALDGKLEKRGIADKTEDMTQSVGVDEAGALWTVPVSSGGSDLPTGGAPYQQLVTDGTGTAKWEDRLAYAVKANELIAEQTITTYESGAPGYTAELNGSLRLEEGKTYFVNFDGKDYECVAWPYPERGAICIGNGSIIGADRGNSEPFAFDESDGYIYLDVEEPETHKVSIYAGDTIPVYYDYMPKNMRVIIEDNGKGGGTCNATFRNIANWISSGIPIMAVRIRANGPVINMANIQYITFNVNSGELRLYVSNDFSYLYSEDGTISYPVVS